MCYKCTHKSNRSILKINKNPCFNLCSPVDVFPGVKGFSSSELMILSLVLYLLLLLWFFRNAFDQNAYKWIGDVRIIFRIWNKTCVDYTLRAYVAVVVQWACVCVFRLICQRVSFPPLMRDGNQNSLCLSSRVHPILCSSSSVSVDRGSLDYVILSYIPRARLYYALDSAEL